MRSAFIKYGFHWEIVEKDMIANAAVKIESKKLYIKKNSRFSSNSLKRIIVHEIGTHVMRAENGLCQPYRFLGRGIPGYLNTEEGLAVYNEENSGCLNNFVLKVYAGRVIAIDMALRCSFRETYEELTKHFTKNTAWRITLRAKRGLSDTSLPGAFTKDLAYLQGYYDVKKFLANRGNINDLYYGKIGTKHVMQVKRLPGLINPTVLPMMRYLNYFKTHFSSVFGHVLLMDDLKPLNLNLKLDYP
jgi:hypothetical protein